MSLPKLISSPRMPFAVTLAVSLGLVGSSVLLAELLRLSACPLCIVQRMLYLMLTLFALAGLALARHPLGRRLAALAMVATAGSGAFVAGYQTWLQRFAKDVQCTGNYPWWERLVDWAGEQVPILFQANGLCSSPEWIFLKLSIAEWSLVAFGGLSVVALYALFQRQRQ